MAQPQQKRGVLGWPLFIGVVVVIIAAVVIALVATKSSPSASPSTSPSASPSSTLPPAPEPLNPVATVTGTRTAPTITLKWDAPQMPSVPATHYLVNVATARLSTNVTSKPYQSPCLQLTKTTAASSVVLPAPFNVGVYYVDVTAHASNKSATRGAPILMYGPFGAKLGHSYTPTHVAAGAIPAFEWCSTQGLSQ